MEKVKEPIALTLNKALIWKKFMTELITFFHKLRLNNFRIFLFVNYFSK